MIYTNRSFPLKLLASEYVRSVLRSEEATEFPVLNFDRLTVLSRLKTKIVVLSFVRKVSNRKTREICPILKQFSDRHYYYTYPTHASVGYPF